MRLWATERPGAEAFASGTLGAHLHECAARPGSPDNPALVVQGGGLRGIYSLGALAVLEELGLRDAFSRVVGSSAGAINGAYFLAGQARESISIYTDELSNREFVCPWRLWKIVDVDYMIDMLKQRHPLNAKAMLAAPATLYTVLTDAETAAATVVSNRDPRFDAYEVFRATAALPGLYDKKVKLRPNGRLYIDGGVAGVVPLAQAAASDPLAEAGAQNDRRETLVLLTRGKGHRKTECHFALRAAARLLLSGQSRPVRRKIWMADRIYNEAMDRLDREERRDGPRRTWCLRPTDPGRLVKRTTNDREKLRDCAELARADTLALLTQEHHSRAMALSVAS